MRHATARSAALGTFATIVFALALSPLSARADCITGPGSTGMETGNRTLSVSLKNTTPSQLNSSAVCTPSSLTVAPPTYFASTGRAEISTGAGGYSAHASVFAGSLVIGFSRATAAGSARFHFRVASQPGYTGPTTVDVELPVLFEAEGSGSANGRGSSFSGTYTSDGSFKEVGAFGGTYLYHASGATATATPTLYTSTHAIAIDTDYFVSIPLSIQVEANAAYDILSNTIGSAESSGTVHVSWGVDIAQGFLDPDLGVEFGMVSGPLGLDPPVIGNPPLLPSEIPVVPILGALGGALCAASMAGLGVRRLRRGKR